MRDSQLEREKILSEQRDIHNFIERKADRAFRGACAAHARLSEAQGRVLTELFMNRVSKLHSQRMELYQANL